METVESGNARAIAAVQKLWTEYWASLGFSPDFQDFAEELRTLPGKYAPPRGRLLLVEIDGQPAGTAAFRSLNESACEGKRLYVNATYRRQGIAGSLLAKLIEEARRCGYSSLYGDSMPTMKSALALYSEFGFVEVGPYSEDPTPGAIYVRLSL